MGTQLPSLKQGAEPPQNFRPIFTVAKRLDASRCHLYTEVGLGLRDIVFDVDPATPREKGHTHPTQFLAHVYCGQMAGWMKTPLGTQVYLGPGHIVLDVVPSLPQKRQSSPPLFGPCLLWPRSPISATAELLSFLLYFSVFICVCLLTQVVE